MAYRSLRVKGEQLEASELLIQGSLTCGSLVSIATLRFDPSMLALPTTETQKSRSDAMTITARTRISCRYPVFRFWFFWSIYFVIGASFDFWVRVIFPIFRSFDPRFFLCVRVLVAVFWPYPGIGFLFFVRMSESVRFHIIRSSVLA